MNNNMSRLNSNDIFELYYDGILKGTTKFKVFNKFNEELGTTEYDGNKKCFKNSNLREIFIGEDFYYNYTYEFTEENRDIYLFTLFRKELKKYKLKRRKR